MASTATLRSRSIQATQLDISTQPHRRLRSESRSTAFAYRAAQYKLKGRALTTLPRRPQEAQHNVGPPFPPPDHSLLDPELTSVRFVRPVSCIPMVSFFEDSRRISSRRWTDPLVLAARRYAMCRDSDDLSHLFRLAQAREHHHPRLSPPPNNANHAPRLLSPPPLLDLSSRPAPHPPATTRMWRVSVRHWWTFRGDQGAVSARVARLERGGEETRVEHESGRVRGNGGEERCEGAVGQEVHP